jgi:uncharacterized protein YjlB
MQPLVETKQYIVKDNGTFPGSGLPVLLYKKVISIFPLRFITAFIVKSRFRRNGWSNSWVAGIFTYHHSNTHEVMGIIHGSTSVQLGGEPGIVIAIEKGEVLIIPAGVAHKNLGNENAVTCVGAYPGGADYDMNYGNLGERPQTDKNIAEVGVPVSDPVFGASQGLPKIWQK